MPVPVPCLPKQPAHPVIKSHHNDSIFNGDNHSFGGLTIPLSPTGPPPSFGTREQWINSLPSWRRSKPRRIWEDDSHSFNPGPQQGFHQGLAGAVNAPVIKGVPAKACLPPLSSVYPLEGAQSDVDMYIAFDNPAVSSGNAAIPARTNHHVVSRNANVAYNDQNKGAFSPIFEDQSPTTRSDQDPSSSPLEPVTPFGDYVDRAVATSQYDQSYPVQERGVYEDMAQYCPQLTQPVFEEMPKEPVPAPASAPELVTPTATAGYRKLSEPLSDWIANFVWKACTTGLNLPSFASRPIATKSYPVPAPSYLATSVHSLLLSTLLQPSAIFLSLWYIIRLPIYFGTVGLNGEHVKELHFRVALLGDSRPGQDRDTMENNAPFRLIVLGCMLANKWLDDHTFSNKTWHSISSVPLQSLNKLESLALDIFSYDLSVSSSDWSQWMSQVLSYHLSLSSPIFPQPISRPSLSPHHIIRSAIEEIIQAPAVCNFDPSNPQPVFMGLEERKKEHFTKEQALNADVSDIDLDEDGPLREEYMPRRRISGAGSTRSAGSENHPPTRPQIWEADKNTIEHCLPPPAKWSPAGDEPILRENNRAYGRYVAVQPTPAHNVHPYQLLPTYQPTHEIAYGNPWLGHAAFPAAKPLPFMGHAFDFSAVHHPPPPPAYNPLLIPFPLSHSRSNSYSHDQDTSQSHNHMRSYSQSQFEYRCSDLRMTANELPSVPNETWGPAGHYAYPPAPAFVPHPSVSYQSAWLRT
ncbi:hypothetical protein D9758_001305 [Tetrapyrgos nigripes]|uniref:Uncharacterized protein n=1 Tax=Tetrapyrgos nigripes TaxID=182062 RepID=A0A8H5GS56_9AGAR|nr:hypothetical protein D9758_001305 [Tetrapyrgos nigripes]